MSSIKTAIKTMIDTAKTKGLRVNIEHRQFSELVPVRVYANGRIKNAQLADKNRERELKGTHSYARAARGITIVRLTNGRKIVSRGISICGSNDKFNKNHGVVKALNSALKSLA